MKNKKKVKLDKYSWFKRLNIIKKIHKRVFNKTKLLKLKKIVIKQAKKFYKIIFTAIVKAIPHIKRGWKNLRSFLKKLHQSMESKWSTFQAKYLPESNEDWEIEDNVSGRYMHSILWVSAVFIIIAIVWASFAKLDEVTIAEGKVIPSSQIQIIDNLEGGIIKEVFVKDGDIVKKGQALMQLDPTRFASSYQEGLAKEAALNAKIGRLNAEVENRPYLPNYNLEKNSDSSVKQELELYNSRQQQLSQLQQNVELMNKEINMTEPLVKQGAASPIELLRLKRSLTDLSEKINNFRSDTLNQLTQAKGDLAALREANKANYDRLTRTTVRSPVQGIVKHIEFTTKGGVIGPGDDLMEIVPLNDTLLIEAKVRPSDIGFLRPGLPATVKITAYDYPIYGGLIGQIEQISADTIVDEKDQKQQSYYLIRVRTQKNYLGSSQHPMYIIPGMLSTVDILTGEKSVLHYLLKPVLRAKERALRER